VKTTIYFGEKSNRGEDGTKAVRTEQRFISSKYQPAAKVSRLIYAPVDQREEKSDLLSQTEEKTNC
jgi:hypothetical protein